MEKISDIEKKILEFWKENKIFKKSLEKKGKNFVFYEGPPTANGKPGIHHVEARAFKDAIPRYKTMRGYHVERKAGWDTQGLPVELEVEKELGFKNKKDIENYGIAKFNQKCKESVWKYKEEWEKMTERMGYWVDMEDPYITYDNNYIESLWWIIKQIYDKGLVYKGYKVVPQCPRCGTALSSHEVAQGYKNVQEESVYIKFKVKGKDNEYILAWTTTPWTLPGNIALAIGEKIEYVKIKQNNEFYYLAKNLLDKINGGYETIEELKGTKMIGWEYEPLFNGVIKGNEKNTENAFKIYPANFVSTEDGTGIVHTAVMYGVEDYELGEKIGLPKVHTVNLDGTFNELVPQWKGKFVKDAEKEIIEDLKQRNVLYKTEAHNHDYPFCWRCDSPLIYYARDSWYFEMSKLREKLIKNNEKINWIPEHVKEGRFGEWLKEVKDWAISRERYWGTPIPIWICEKCNEMKVIGSCQELGVDEKFDLHKPFIDEIKFKCPSTSSGQVCGGEMKRTPEVMDSWFDSGAMPFAQHHYPFENKNLIDKGEQFPADFISEAVDQTRGWFYTLLAVSTMLGKESPYKNVICLGHILDKDGQKMSKHIGNVVDPILMIEKYGADVVRWYIYNVNQPGEPKRFSEEGLKESGSMFNTLLNVLSFYKIFAEGTEMKDLNENKDPVNVLDKWIGSKLSLLIKNVEEHLNDYDIFSATRKIQSFIEDLSVWYVRRSRDRFKNGGEDKLYALKTLRYVLFRLSELMAPFTPFMAEHIYKEVGGGRESVHLEDWPEVDKKLIDEKLEEQMQQVREICSMGLQKRAEAGIKVRQPLAKLKIKSQKLKVELLDLIRDEINVKEVVMDDNLKEGVVLDTTITEELKAEGAVRDFVRTIQSKRKEMGLTPKDKIRVYYSDNKEIVEKYADQIKKQVIAEEIVFGDEFKIEKT
ncbi:MAG: isoleucine--tRNA ligase [Patescibacteria group bacterium]